VRDDDVIAQPLIDFGVLETRDATDVLDHKATNRDRRVDPPHH
jgi:hypothetical protein